MVQTPLTHHVILKKDDPWSRFWLFLSLQKLIEDSARNGKFMGFIGSDLQDLTCGSKCWSESLNISWEVGQLLKIWKSAICEVGTVFETLKRNRSCAPGTTTVLFMSRFLHQQETLAIGCGKIMNRIPLIVAFGGIEGGTSSSKVTWA